MNVETAVKTHCMEGLVAERLKIILFVVVTCFKLCVKDHPTVLKPIKRTCFAMCFTIQLRRNRIRKKQIPRRGQGQRNIPPPFLISRPELTFFGSK